MARRPTEIVRDEQTQAPLAGVLISVIDAATGLAATLTYDGGASMANPLTTDSLGAYYYNATDAVYIEELRYGGRLIQKNEVIVGEPPAFTGAAGPANVLSVGTVTKVAAGGTPTVSITGTSPSQVLNVGLVTGDPGTTGATGAPGYTSTDTWAHLNAITPSGGAGSTGFAIGPDTGTHTDANGATSIPNTGQFTYQASPAGWIRIGSSLGPVDAASANTATLLAEAQTYARAVKSAVGPGTVKAIIDMDGPRTAYSGSATILTALQSLDDTPITLSVYSSIFAGADPRPYYDARGIYMGSQGGLQTTSPILTKTSGDFAFLYAIDLNTVTGTVGLKTSLPATPAEGDMTLVNGDRNVITGLGNDVPIVLDTAWTASDLVNGYYKWNSSSGGGSYEASFSLFKATGPSGSRFEAAINHLGQFTMFIYDGTNSVSLLSKGSVLMGQSKVLIAIRRKGSSIYVVVNGSVVFAIGSASLPSITDLNQWYFNGSSRTANTVQPIANGLRHYLKGLVVADDLPTNNFRDLHDVVAQRHGTPAMFRANAARGVVVYGQSWTDGTVDTSSNVWRAGPNSWDGKTHPNNTSYATETATITREAFSNVFVHRGRANPDDIGPWAIQVDTSGNLSSGTSHDLDVSGENFLAGWAKQVNLHKQGAATDWIVSGFGIGGATIATLAAQSVVPLVQQLKTITLPGSDYYNLMLREIVYARDFALARGQTYTVDLFIWQQGHSDATNAAYLTALYALYDRFVTDVQAITGQSHKPILLSPQINYSSAGTANECNSGSGVIDQLFIDMEEGGRGTRPMFCVGPMYQITNFIHPYRAGHRWIGEIFGRSTTQILFDGEAYGSLHPYAYTYSVGGTTIDIDYRVRSGRALTLSQTNDNNIYTTATNQGFDFTDLSAGGVTISSIAATSATRIRVTLTGGTIGAGDTIRYVGSQRFGNVADGAKVDGLYRDQDWAATFVSNSPPFANGNLDDLRQWACASRKVL